MGNGRAVEIDWGTANVNDARLSVGLSGAPPKGLAKQLELVIARLATTGRRWGDVSFGKRTLHVDDVQDGAEDDLRHFLESALLQANALAGAEPGDPADAEEAGPDAEMTSVFRSFADR